MVAARGDSVSQSQWWLGNCDSRLVGVVFGTGPGVADPLLGGMGVALYALGGGAPIHGAVEPRAGHDRAGDLLIQYDLSNGGVNPSIKQVVANDRQKLRFRRFQTGGTWYVD